MERQWDWLQGSKLHTFHPNNALKDYNSPHRLCTPDIPLVWLCKIMGLLGCYILMVLGTANSQGLTVHIPIRDNTDHRLHCKLKIRKYTSLERLL